MTPLEITLDTYFQVIIAALATLAVAVASVATAYVIKTLDSWRKWRH